MFMMSFCGPAGLFPFYSSSQMVSTVKGLVVRIPVKADKCGILITPDCSPTVFLYRWFTFLYLFASLSYSFVTSCILICSIASSAVIVQFSCCIISNKLAQHSHHL